jgi:hypothetical protein
MTPAGIVVLVPVLRRPWRAAPLVESFAQATEPPYRIVFICTPDDADEIAAVRATGAARLIVPWQTGPGDWARKINYGFRSTLEPLMLLGADDISPHPGWAEEIRSAAGLGFGVIGTNDLGNPEVMGGGLSTHPIVTRRYAVEHGTIDGPGVVHEGYRHNFVDNELAGTALSRGAWAFCSAAKVEHLHPSWGKAPIDDVYTIGRSGFDIDRAYFIRRRELWMRP